MFRSLNPFDLLDSSNIYIYIYYTLIYEINDKFQYILLGLEIIDYTSYFPQIEFK